MKSPLSWTLGFAALFAGGCASPSGGQAERGPDGTIAFKVMIESSEAGARIEVNDDYVGHTPIEVRVWGDPDGTFHNFGSSDFVFRVFPVREEQGVQTRIFRTGGWFAQEDRIPQRLDFDLNRKSEGGFTVEPGQPCY